MNGDPAKHPNLREDGGDTPEQRAYRLGVGCERNDCPGPDGLESGYGLTGGGIGLYKFCPLCGAIVSKVQDNGE